MQSSPAGQHRRAGVHRWSPLQRPQTHPGEVQSEPVVHDGAPQPLFDRGHGRTVESPLPERIQKQEERRIGDLARDVLEMFGRTRSQTESSHRQHQTVPRQVDTGQDDEVGLRGRSGEAAQKHR